jgi:hypothetical protein
MKIVLRVLNQRSLWQAKYKNRVQLKKLNGASFVHYILLNIFTAVCVTGKQHVIGRGGDY